MKVFAAVLVACLVMSVCSQSANQAASTGGLTGANVAGLAGTQRSGMLGGNIMGLAAMTGQLGDGMQRMLQCQMMGLPSILCLSM